MILVTGATGFVGRAVVHRLLAEDTHRCMVAVRRVSHLWPQRVPQHIVGDMGASTDWSSALRGASCIVHCAARVHVMDDQAADPLAEFRRTNVAGTLALARQAAAIGVRRFVFVSSIKVNGSQTIVHNPFRADDVPMPADSYGISKWEAEQGLREISAQAGMEVVIVRPPLVYGPGVKANFATLVRWLRRGIPLPLGGIHNRRSLVGLDNLVDLLVRCVSHPAAAGQIFLVSDGEDISTTELLCRIGQALGQPARLVPVPVIWLQMAAAVLGQRAVAQRLCDFLQVDIEKTREVLGWQPPVSLSQGLKQAVQGMYAKLEVPVSAQ